ncbi:MAG: hypothetical protein AB7D47_13185 [Desulfovibrio sp.]
MRAVCIKTSMVKGVVYSPGEILHVDREEEKPRHFRWEWDTEHAIITPLPLRSADALLIIGDAGCLLDDVDRLSLPTVYEVMALNRAPLGGPYHRFKQPAKHVVAKMRKHGVWVTAASGALTEVA